MSWHIGFMTKSQRAQKEIDDKKRFRLQAKRLFLTYPQCPAPKEILLQKLQEKLGQLGIEKYVIGQEEHKDGNLHLHAIVSMKKKCNIVSPRALDIEFDGVQYHGKYEPMKGSLIQAANYVTKHDKEALLKNIDMVSLAHATKSKKKYISQQVMEGKSLTKCIEENPEHLFDFANW